MSDVMNPADGIPLVIEQSPADVRAAFIRRTYAHLAGAILAFAALETALVHLVPQEAIIGMMTGYWPLLFLGGFMLVSWIAHGWARSAVSREIQYLGLGLYVVAEALFFLPLLWVANNFAKGGVIPTAGILTLAAFGGLTVTVFVTRQDFSYLRTILYVGGFLAMGLVVAAMIFGFGLGLWFSFAMVALACGFILYDTSNVLHHYRTTQHVAAALALFASVALLFWYILRILMASRD